MECLEAYVEFWGNYIPEVYGMAKALLAARETDEAAAAAWDDRMGAVRESCHLTIECGWSTNQYVNRMQEFLKRAFVQWPEGT